MNQYNQLPTATVLHTGPAEQPKSTQLLEAQVRQLTQQLDTQRKRIARMEQTITQLETKLANR